MKKLKLFSLLMLLFVGVTSMWAASYQLINSTDDLEADAHYIIGSAASGSAKFMATTENSDNRRGTDAITITDGKISATSSVLVLKLEGSTGKWKLKTTNYAGTDGYLYNADSGTGNKCYVGATEREFTITFSGDAAVITATGGNSRNILRYNGGTNNLFACYGSGQSPVYLFKEVPTYAVTISNPSNGTISVKNGTDDVADGTKIEEGTDLTVSIADVTGYRFSLKYKVGDGAWNSIANGGNISMPASAITITADELALFNVAVAVNDANMGAATINGGTSAIYVDDDDDITLVATPELGYEFVNWTVSDEDIVLDDANDATTTASAGASGTITANFKTSSKPSVSADPVSIAFGTVDKSASVDAESFAITGLNLTSALAISSTNAVFSFEVTSGSLTPTAGAVNATIAVTPSTANAGNFNGNITISGGGLAEAVNVPVSITVLNKYTVSFNVGGGTGTINPIEEASAGAGITLPAGPTPSSPCVADDWEFAGWAEAAVATATTTAPTLLSGTYHPTSNCTLYAVYKKVETNTEDGSKTETFENQTAGTDYQNTINYTAANSNAGLAWTMYYGTVSTNDVVCGSKNAQMRWYSGDKVGNRGYILTTTPVSGLQTVPFKARVSNTGVKVAVWYSTDGENWTLNDNDLTLDATGAGGIKTFTSTINGTIGTNYYIKIGISSGSTAPSSGNYKLGIDSVKFDYKTSSSTTTYHSVPVCSVKYDVNIALGILNGTVEADKETAAENDEVTLTAHPATGYQLSAWIVKDENEDAVTVTNNKFNMPASDVLVSATFVQSNYTVTMEQSGNAGSTISADQANKHYEDVISISATAVDGYYFLGWEADVEVTFANAKALATTFSMPASNVTVTAKFAKILSVAEALALIPSSGNRMADQVVKGYIKTVDSYNSTYHSITYTIMDLDANGFATSTTIKAYGGLGIDGSDFSSKSDLEVGAKVLVFGELYYHSTGGQEINTNNYQLSYDAGTYAGVVIYGEASKTAYEKGETFVFTGLNAKDTWSNGYAAPLTVEDDGLTWTATPNTINESGDVVVEASYVYDAKTYKGTTNVAVTLLTHELTYTAAYEHGSVDVKYLGETVATGDHFVKGDVLTITATPESAEYKLASLTVNDDPFTSGNTYTVDTDDIVVVAVFSVATGFEDVETSVKAVKVLRDGQIFILRGDKTFNAQGQLVN